MKVNNGLPASINGVVSHGVTSHVVKRTRKEKDGQSLHDTRHRPSFILSLYPLECVGMHTVFVSILCVKHVGCDCCSDSAR